MPHRRTIAILDLGSNSFHLLVARTEDDRISVIDALKEPVRLRSGLLPDGTLTDESQERALACLSRYAQRLRGLHPDDIRAVGTNTLRRAKNTGDFIDKIESLLGVPLEIIGAGEEARLIYLGVANYLPPSPARNFVVDIGGGSTEFIVGVNLEARVRESRPLGCVGWTMDFFPDGIVTKKRFKKAVMTVEQELEGFHQTFSPDKWDRAIGASGTLKAVGAVISALGGGDTITMAGLRAIKERLPWGAPLTANSFPGLNEERVPVFIGGFAVTFGIFKAFAIPAMSISQNSIREGLLLESLGRAQDKDIRTDTVARLQTVYGVDQQQSERVKRTAMHLFAQIMGLFFERRQLARQVLGWAADLHEIGLSIAHTGYHKHGAYIILNGDLDGFSRVEQSFVSFLVLNHRKRLKTDPMLYENRMKWALVLILRLAFIFNRERITKEPADVAINWQKKNIIDMFIGKAWLAHNPMTVFDLQLEQKYWKGIGYTLNLNGQAP